MPALHKKGERGLGAAWRGGCARLLPAGGESLPPTHDVEFAWRAALMRGASSDGSGDGAYGQPFRGSGHAAQGTSPFGDADGFVALVGQDGGLGVLVRQVA